MLLLCPCAHLEWPCSLQSWRYTADTSGSNHFCDWAYNVLWHTELPVILYRCRWAYWGVEMAFSNLFELEVPPLAADWDHRHTQHCWGTWLFTASPACWGSGTTQTSAIHPVNSCLPPSLGSARVFCPRSRCSAVAGAIWQLGELAHSVHHLRMCSDLYFWM